MKSWCWFWGEKTALDVHSATARMSRMGEAVVAVLARRDSMNATTTCRRGRRRREDAEEKMILSNRKRK